MRPLCQQTRDAWLIRFASTVYRIGHPPIVASLKPPPGHHVSVRQVIIVIYSFKYGQRLRGQLPPILLLASTLLGPGAKHHVPPSGTSRGADGVTHGNFNHVKTRRALDPN